LEAPPGRNPPDEIVELSRSWHRLDENQRSFCKKIITQSVRTAVFDFFCVLDGVRKVDERLASGDLRLELNIHDESYLISSTEHFSTLHDYFGDVNRDDKL